MNRYRVWADGSVQNTKDGEPYSWLSDDFEVVSAQDEESAIAVSRNCGAKPIPKHIDFAHSKEIQMKIPRYPKGDLRRMLAVLGAIEAGHCTLVQIVAATNLDKKTVTSLIAQAVEQACVSIEKNGATYSVKDWGPVLKKDGAKKALTGALNAPIIEQ